MAPGEIVARIGVDESGTGAFAGPFTVCAGLVLEKDVSALREAGGQDSKSLTDAKRRARVIPMLDVALGAYCEVVPVIEIVSKGHQFALEDAFVYSLYGALELVPKYVSKVRVVVDGYGTPTLRDRMRRVSPLVYVAEFVTKADVSDPSVGMASILAKTIRNDRMLELHEEFPEYRWNKNYGYGTNSHINAIEEFGVCEEHRRIKSLRGMKRRKEKA